MFNVIYSDNADEDIKNIHRYISEDNINIADKVIAEIYGTCDHLELFPELGTSHNSNLRRIVNSKYSYSIYYKIDSSKKNVSIIAINKYKNFN